MVFSGLVARSGLAPLITVSYQFVKRIVASAFVERWQPETNTFHMPYGEMTITLDDVGTILGIPMTGRSISIKTLPYEWDESLVCYGLGMTPQEPHDELTAVRGLPVRLEWLRELFGEI